VLATCASHSEPSRLGEALELLAQVRYQVGFASLEQNLVVAGDLAADVAGVSVAALFGAGVLLPDVHGSRSRYFDGVTGRSCPTSPSAPRHNGETLSGRSERLL
jgi:hypothetical protein